MNEAEAFEILGLKATASEDEIQARFIELAYMNHPDKGGENEAMVDLLLARDGAINKARNRSLVPVSKVREIVHDSTLAIMKTQKQRELTRKLLRQIIRLQLIRLRRNKRMAALLGTFTAVMTVSSSQGAPVIIDLIPKSSLQNHFPLPIILSAFFGFYTLVFGILYLRLTYQGDHIEYLSEDAIDELDDKSTYLDMFFEIFGKSDVTEPLTRVQVEAFVGDWIKSNGSRMNSHKSFARDIGPIDFTKLAIAKGLEHGVLREQEAKTNGRALIQYYFSFETESN